MSEAVIVATARSPIGRAGKGSLVDMRPDDLAAQMVRAALDKVPALDPKDIDDLIMGCGQPGGEAGFNIGRAVAVELGYDFLPGTTVNRYCSSSLQTTRMAFHAIKAGEGSAFISAGVETVSRFPKGTSDGWPDSHNPLFADAEERSVSAASGADEWHDPREDGLLPDVYIAMGQTAENVALLHRHQPRRPGPLGRAQPEPRRGGHQQRLLRARDLAGDAARRVEGQHRRRAAGGHHLREGQPAQAGVPAERHGHGGQRLPAERRCGSGDRDERRQGQGARPDAAGAHRGDGRERAVAGDHGPRPDRGDAQGAGQRRHDDRRHRPRTRSTRRSRCRCSARPASWAWTTTS